MTGIAHLSTGLFLKGRFPRAPLAWLLLATEAPDLLWAALNLLHATGEEPLEVVRARQPFRYIGDLLLLEQPFSHSLLMNLALALVLGGLAHLAFRRSGVGLGAVAAPVFMAVLGHWVLDFVVHDADLALTPWGDTRLGPALALDASMPMRGLSSTHPLASWALQSALVFGCGVAFIARYPSNARGRRVFAGMLAALTLLAAPVFIPGLAGGLVQSSVAVVTAALVEIVVLTLVMYLVITRVSHPLLYPWQNEPSQSRPSPSPDSPQLANLLRGLELAGAALGFALSATYLLQAGLDAQLSPALGATSTLLGLLYFGLGCGMAGANLSAWWPALFMPLLFGPLARACFGVGRLGLLHTGLELLLCVIALYSIRTLRVSRILL